MKLDKDGAIGYKYFSDSESSFFKEAKEIVDKARRGELEVCISLQNLSEFYAIVANPK